MTFRLRRKIEPHRLAARARSLWSTWRASTVRPCFTSSRPTPARARAGLRAPRHRHRRWGPEIGAGGVASVGEPRPREDAWYGLALGSVMMPRDHDLTGTVSQPARPAAVVGQIRASRIARASGSSSPNFSAQVGAVDRFALELKNADEVAPLASTSDRSHTMSTSRVLRGTPRAELATDPPTR